jgi:hypothetical protein
MGSRPAENLRYLKSDTYGYIILYPKRLLLYFQHYINANKTVECAKMFMKDTNYILIWYNVSKTSFCLAA